MQDYRTLADLTSTIKTLNTTSVLKQIFMGSDISKMIDRAYEDIDAAASELQVCLRTLQASSDVKVMHSWGRNWTYTMRNMTTRKPAGKITHERVVFFNSF